MTHHDVEQELRHLEYVFGHIAATDDVPPLSYWRKRLEALRRLCIIPSQQKRVHRLDELLRQLELPTRLIPEPARHSESSRPAHRAER